MEWLGLYNRPEGEVHLGQKVKGHKGGRRRRSTDVANNGGVSVSTSVANNGGVPVSTSVANNGGHASQHKCS